MKTAARLASMKTEFDSIVTGSADANVDDEHDPEGATIAFERALVVTLMGEAEEYLVELDHAMHRLDDRNYSVCEGCGGEISDERLRARPASRTCIACSTPRGRRLGR